MNFKTLGDYQKWLEKNFSPEIMIPTLPVVIRLDGVGFSKYTKKLKKPFDENLTSLMIDLTKFLVTETNAVIGYHQSDEITLILYTNSKESSIYNDGKKQKILSKLTGKAVQYFNQERLKYLPNHDKIANFDCRIYQTPSLHDACMSLQFREYDATRNSIQMLAHSLFNDKEMDKINTSTLQDKMMLDKGVNWNDLESKYKRGTYVRRVKTSKKYTFEELEKLHPNHNAIKNPDLVIERSVISVMDMPIFNTVKNKVDVVFYGAEPITHEQYTN